MSKRAMNPYHQIPSHQAYSLRCRCLLLWELFISAQVFIWSTGGALFFIGTFSFIYNEKYVEDMINVGYLCTVVSMLAIAICMLFHRIVYQAQNQRLLLKKSFMASLLIMASLFFLWLLYVDFIEAMLHILGFWLIFGCCIGGIFFQGIYSKPTARVIITLLLMSWYAWLMIETFLVQDADMDRLLTIVWGLLSLLGGGVMILVADFCLSLREKTSNQD